MQTKKHRTTWTFRPTMRARERVRAVMRAKLPRLHPDERYGLRSRILNDALENLPLPPVPALMQ